MKNDEFQVLHTPNFLHEALMAVVRRGEADGSAIVDRHREYGLAAEELSSMIGACVRYHRAVLEDVQPLLEQNADLMCYFDDTLPGSKHTPNSIAFGVAELISAAGDGPIADADIDGLMLRILTGELPEAGEPSVPPEEILRRITEMELDDRSKVSLVGFYLGRHEAVRRMRALLAGVAEACERRFDIVEEECRAEADRVREMEGMRDTLLDILRVREGTVEGGITARMSAISFDSLGMDLDTGRSEMRLGVHFLRLYALENEQKNENVSDFKAIADPTRWKILRLLKHDSMYLSQLAEKLSLTPATVLHHLDVLLETHFVRISVFGEKSRRARYSLDPKALRSAARRLTQLAEEAEHEKEEG